MLTYFRAVVIGLLQGVTELFPISSLGHSVFVPALLGWNDITRSQSSGESPYLAFLVGLHVATAIALLIYFRRDWDRIIRGIFRSTMNRRISDSDERLGWLLIVASIPTGVLGLLFEHRLRTVFAKPLAASLFLTVNGVILGVGEWARRRAASRADAPEEAVSHDDASSRRRLATFEFREAGFVGVAQTASLFAGISRSGVTMVAGLLRGLDHEDAARFSFLLATPIILAAGVYKLPDLFGPLGNGIRGQVLVGSIVSGLAAYAAVRFLVNYFETRTLTPFAIYSLVVGGALSVRFGFF
ncbi:MAG: bacA [Acidimicrobiales bacterium]|nr:bacA [Acidimicrobiales bacterium]